MREDFRPVRLEVKSRAETELKLIAAAASIGLSKMPKIGYNTPAAIGTPKAL